MAEELPQAKKVIKGNWFYSKIYRRLHTGGNWMLTTCGEVGTGKSWACLRLAYDLDVGPRTGERRFPLDASRVCFDPLDFLKLLQNKNLPKGSFVVLDEAGLNLSSQTWWNAVAQALSGVAQSFRYRQFGLLYTYPGSLNFLNKQLRVLSHTALLMRGVNRRRGYSLGEFKNLQTNIYTAKTYKHTPERDTPNGLEALDHFTFYAPPKELCRAYEEKKKAYLDDYYTQLADKLEQFKTGSRKVDMKKYYDLVLENPREYADDSLRFKSSLLRVKFNLSKENAACLASALNIEKRARRLKMEKKVTLQKA